METLAELRVPRSGDELWEAHYHRTARRYDLSPSINPCRVLGLNLLWKLLQSRPSATGMNPGGLWGPQH